MRTTFRIRKEGLTYSGSEIARYDHFHRIVRRRYPNPCGSISSRAALRDFQGRECSSNPLLISEGRRHFILLR